MKLKEKTEKKKRAPGAGRKPVEDKVKMIPIYLREKRIEYLGGEEEIRDRVNGFLQRCKPTIK